MAANSEPVFEGDFPEQLMSEAHSKYVEGFLQIQIGIATLGASITFALILTPLNPPPAPYDLETVQTLLAVSWLR